MRGDDTRSMERIREDRNTAQTAAALAERKRQHRIRGVFIFFLMSITITILAPTVAWKICLHFETFGAAAGSCVSSTRRWRVVVDDHDGLKYARPLSYIDW